MFWETKAELVLNRYQFFLSFFSLVQIQFWSCKILYSIVPELTLGIYLCLCGPDYFWCISKQEYFETVLWSSKHTTFIHLWYCINIESSHIVLYNIKILVALLGLEYLQAFWGLICFNIPMQGCQYELKIGSAKWDWSRWAEIPGYVRIFSRNLPLTFFTMNKKINC